MVRATLSVLTLALLPTLAAAQEPVPRGSAFQVNTYTSDDQLFPAVGSDGAGGFVVTWTSYGSSGTDTDEFSIQAQRYASDGTPAGSEFQVNTYTYRFQHSPAIGSDGADGFVITWTSYDFTGTAPTGFSIQAQRYASDGTPAGSEFQVNTYTNSAQYDPAVGSDGAAGFVVTWGGEGSTGPDTLASIQARRYASDGTPIGGEFQVNTYTDDAQFNPAVGSDGADGFVVTWVSYGSSGTDTSSTSIQAQRYASDGTPVGGEFQVNTYTDSFQLRPAISSAGATGFVVTWDSSGSSGTDTRGRSIQAQRYASDGTPAGREFQVNTETNSSQEYPAVASDGAAGFVVTWANSAGSSIQAQRYVSDGTPAGSEFQVNTYDTSSQLEPAIGSDGADGFVVTWGSIGSSGTDTSGWSVQAQRYVPPEIFEDGFESGDTSAWSTTVP